MSKLFIVVSLVILLLILSPMVTIWSLNLLFGLGIPNTFGTWFATLWLTALFSGGVKARMV